jgi:type VI secretion system protein ImpG
MQDLLPHYERELAFLRSHAEEFGRRYPRVAGRLAVSGEVLQDPHVERMIQAFALLSSRIHKRLDDDFPLFAESFLDLLYPHYLRPLPSSSIACFDVGSSASQLSRATTIARGTQLHTRPLRGVTCKFRTTSEAQLLPVRVASVSFRGTTTAPTGTDVPRQATATLSIQLELTSPQASWAALGTDRIRLYVDGDPSLVTALRESLTSRVLATMVQTGTVGAWSVDAKARPTLVGLGEEDALVDFDARSHTAYRLLTEYFAFPEKFNFIDLPLPEAALRAPGRTLGLHLSLGGLRKESDDARLLEVVGASNLVIGCAPVTNLFSTRADPIRITQASTMHAVLPDGRRAFGHEVYAIDRVYRVHQTAEGETIQTFKPFYSLQHDDLLRDGEAMGRYWFSHRNAVEGQSPGFETEIGLVDLDFDPSLPQTDTLSIDVRATNRDLPAQMSIGNPGGDLFAEGGGAWREIRLLRKPTPPYRFETGKGLLWRLISQLSLNHLSLTGSGIDALKEMLRLYDLPRSTINQRTLDGVIAVDYKPAQAFLDGAPFATLVRGTEIRLTVDEQSFVGTGLHLFAQVLDRFFALYVHINSFTQLKLVSSRSGEVLVACPRRSGEEPLL